MAFIGAFFVTILIGIFGVLVWIALALIVLAILFIFIPCLIIAIINLVKGAKNKWPKRNVIHLLRDRLSRIHLDRTQFQERLIVDAHLLDGFYLY